jgi:signal transduction histidine kinase
MLPNDIQSKPMLSQVSLAKKESILLETELLKKIDLFGKFSEDAIKIFLKNCNEILLSEDEILFNEGISADHMYLILSGQVAIYKSRKRIAILEAGDFVGEMSLIESSVRSATAIGLSQETLLIEVSEEKFKNFLTSDPHAMFSMMKTLSKRIRVDLQVMSAEMQRINNFTHDMRNCLAPLGIVEVHMEDITNSLKESTDSHTRQNSLNNVNKIFDTIFSVKNNLVVMIDQSLACAKKIKSDYIKADLDTVLLVKETVDEIYCHKLLKNKSIHVNVKGEIPKGHFNSLDIKRVLQNLLINAGYASKNDGQIEILIENVKEYIQVSVRDYGVGIPEEIKPLLLNESYTTKPDGNGFGLMSCREIIQDFHMGEIYFESELGKGTTFYFTLKPAAPGESAES